jgi:catechol 2,3-dioxygenase-like lactoylglutathione lyase family enzyme
MSSKLTSKLLSSAPYFPVSNVERSAAFYEEILGFRREYSAGTPVQFAICSRDGLAIMLRKVLESDLIVPNEKQGGTWDAFFWVSDVQALHAELHTKAADIVYDPLIQEAYQMKEFAVRDCDGHVLGFGQALHSGTKPRQNQR